jgi:hypothetical protein
MQVSMAMLESCDDMDMDQWLPIELSRNFGSSSKVRMQHLVVSELLRTTFALVSLVLSSAFIFVSSGFQSANTTFRRHFSSYKPYQVVMAHAKVVS